MFQNWDLKNFASLDTPDNREDIRKCITKIMNTLSFRKLAGKTQVILSLTGPDVRTRLTHTIEVAKIAKDICIALGLNGDLAEAVALAHDIGHTPFGHVGERTLREIMCGCDTLKDKIIDCDFNNSGFKHNLQSFRVLKDLDRITDDKEYKNIWPYILWGVLSHTKMTYAKSYSGMEDEILISSKHCDLVYACYYDKKKECKRNIQEKKKKGKESKIEICKPWFCAQLNVITDEKHVVENNLNPGETSRERVKNDYFKDKHSDKIYCLKRCYLSKLWRHKIEHNSIAIEYPYLFDHPFPNSFYAEPLKNYFKKLVSGNQQDFISFEAQIVSQADEIAQRQQDLEDGLSKDLLSFSEAKEQVKDLIKPFGCKSKYRIFLEDIKKKNRSEDLGKILVDFYKQLIVDRTLRNVEDFIKESGDGDGINIFSFMNILYSMDKGTNKKGKWILEELRQLSQSPISESDFKINCLKDYFRIDLNSIYLYLLSYDHIETCVKRFDFSGDTFHILSECIGLLHSDLSNQLSEQVEDMCELGAGLQSQAMLKLEIELNKLREKRIGSNLFEFEHLFIKTLDLLRDYLFKYYQFESNDFFINRKKKWWKNIGGLKLFPFYLFCQIYETQIKVKRGTTCIRDLNNFVYKNGYDSRYTFKDWKKKLKSDANKALNNLITFVDENGEDNKKDALEKFENVQKNTILKSEAVEKNDGKASYMLKRMFRAYIDNSHQLPDFGLKFILSAIQETDMQTALFTNEKKTFEEILNKLRKTMIDGSKKIEKIKGENFFDLVPKAANNKFEKLTKGTSNEVKAALEKRRELYVFFIMLRDEQKTIKNNLKSQNRQNKVDLKKILNKFRAHLDNPILNATPQWKSILSRGICDYIASLTDQEAINEYEKLYAGIMELV